MSCTVIYNYIGLCRIHEKHIVYYWIPWNFDFIISLIFNKRLSIGRKDDQKKGIYIMSWKCKRGEGVWLYPFLFLPKWIFLCSIFLLLTHWVNAYSLYTYAGSIYKCSTSSHLILNNKLRVGQEEFWIFEESITICSIVSHGFHDFSITIWTSNDILNFCCFW